MTTTHTPTPYSSMTFVHSAEQASAQALIDKGIPVPTALHMAHTIHAHDALTARVAELEAALRGIAMGAAPDGSAHFTVEMARRMASAALAK